MKQLKQRSLSLVLLCAFFFLGGGELGGSFDSVVYIFVD